MGLYLSDAEAQSLSTEPVCDLPLWPHVPDSPTLTMEFTDFPLVGKTRNPDPQLQEPRTEQEEVQIPP